MRPYYPLSGDWALTQLSTGQPFYVDTRSRDLTAWIVMGGRWEIFVDDVLSALARPGDTFIDAGSNMGYYTIKIGGLVGPQGRVFAFEANPEMFAFVSENIHLNALSGCALAQNVALGDRSGEFRFAHEPGRAGGGLVLLPNEAPSANRHVQMVPMVRLDDALPAPTRIDLMKIDVEGFEVPVFRGMVETLGCSPDAAIVCEVHVSQWARFGDPAKLLTECAGGRRLYRIFEDGHLEEMEGDRLGEWLEPDFGAYVLMLPDTPERLAQLDPLFARFAPPPPEPVEPPPPPPPPSLMQRIARRLRS